MMRHIVAFMAAVALLCSILSAQETVRIGSFNRNGPFIHYRENGISALAARFDIPVACELDAFRLHMNGPEGSTARVRIFGHEGGAPSPLFERDIAEPIRITKTRAGIEVLDVTLPASVMLEQGQVFLVVDSASPGLHLLSDRKRRAAVCVSADGPYCRQLLRKADGVWEYGVYAFAAELEVRPVESAVRFGFRDISPDAPLCDSASNAGVCWADVDRDGWLDALVGGRLLRNNEGRFVDVTDRAGLAGRPLLQAFIDANGDAAPDILFFGDSASDRCALFVNDGYGAFERHDPGIRAGSPMCFAIADADGDGDMDAALGLRNGVQLLRNIGSLRFRADTLPGGVLASGRAAVAVEWVAAGDGTLDLFAAFDRGAGLLWRNTGGGLEPARSLAPGGASGPGQGAAGAAWEYGTRERKAELLMPSAITPQAARESSAFAGPAVYVRQPGAASAALNSRADLEYRAYRSGAAWGDFDSDGRPDFVTASVCSCASVELYHQREDGRFERATSEAGLVGVTGGPDAVWVDYDNDGRLDLAIPRGGALKVYRNETPASGNAIGLDLGALGIGAEVTVVAGGRSMRRAVTSGRGLGMQGPARLHFGLGDAPAADSVIVRWPGGSETVYTGLAAGKIHALNGGSASAAGVAVAAWPNPFVERVVLTVTLSRAGTMRVRVFNGAGQEVATLADGVFDAGEHALTFTARDASGRPLPQGAYFYRVETPGGEASGTAVLRR